MDTFINSIKINDDINNNMCELEFIDTIESCYHLIDSIIINNPMIYSKPEFNTIIIDYVYNILVIQFENININTKIINIVIKHAISYYHSYINPRRSYTDSVILHKPNTEYISKKINYIKNIPQPEQRTNEWYLFRYNLLTASNIWKAYGSEKTKNQLIYEKCNPINIEKYNTINMESSLHWGQKYEPISIEWYEKKYNTIISDFGCIPHPKLSYIGASPDGINTDSRSDRYGRMLEVKNIVNREITGIPKMEYWIQMQIQMEVCNLNECDFLETRFIEYDNYSSFINDGDFNNSETNCTKGIIICFIKDDKPFYIYAPMYISRSDYDEWERETMEKYKNLVWLKNIYWKLDEISCVLVLRNKFWFNSTKYMLENIWDNILYDRKHGYEHRAPNRKKKLTSSSPNIVCNIILETDNSEIKETNNSEIKETDNSEIKETNNSLSNKENKKNVIIIDI